MDVVLELRVGSGDEAEAQTVTTVLGDENGLRVARLPAARTLDPVTIISVAGGVIGLVNGLLDLRDRWAKGRRTPPSGVTLRNESGDELDVTTATDEELRKFVTASATAE